MIIINSDRQISDLHAEIMDTHARSGKILPVREIKHWVLPRSHLLSAYVTAKNARIDPIPDPGRSFVPSCPVGGIRSCLATRDRAKEPLFWTCLVSQEPDPRHA
jgi:hypothetical protein